MGFKKLSVDLGKRSCAQFSWNRCNCAHYSCFAPKLIVRLANKSRIMMDSAYH
jgi:hypothetical protein